MFKQLQSAVEYVERHKVGAAVLATSWVWYKMNKQALRQRNEFLRERVRYEEHSRRTSE